MDGFGELGGVDFGWLILFFEELKLVLFSLNSRGEQNKKSMTP